jgi:hypothetical protein
MHRSLLKEVLTIKKLLTYMLTHHLSQKFNLIGRGKFNHLVNTLALPLTYELKLPFNR